MGLFDGTGPDGEAGSTAELARITGWPVVLIVDARGQGASVAALLRGVVIHEPQVPLTGVIFNHVSSDRHGALLAEATARRVPFIACLGALPSDPALVLPSRHLGLVPAGEIGSAEVIIERCTARIGAVLDLGRLVRLARHSSLTGAAQSALIPPLGQRIAVARDQAFCFAYPALLESWRRQGAELTYFSPLADEPPCAAADSVYLPGGYPELWADRLETAATFVGGLQQAASAGKPVYGECGGYMTLGDILVDADGGRRKMAGLLPLVTSFAEPRRHLGYRCATLLRSNPLGTAGARFRGHQFHYATVLRQGAGDRLFTSTDAAGRDLGVCGMRQGSVFGSFIHLIDRNV
jgi:cobyrinic acid a,c-diamide synthase